jgi:hypothetical protein
VKLGVFNKKWCINSQDLKDLYSYYLLGIRLLDLVKKIRSSEGQGKTNHKTQGETPVRINLGETNSLIPSLFYFPPLSLHSFHPDF